MKIKRKKLLLLFCKACPMKNNCPPLSIKCSYRDDFKKALKKEKNPTNLKKLWKIKIYCKTYQSYTCRGCRYFKLNNWLTCSAMKYNSDGKYGDHSNLPESWNLPPLEKK